MAYIPRIYYLLSASRCRRDRIFVWYPVWAFFRSQRVFPFNFLCPDIEPRCCLMPFPQSQIIFKDMVDVCFLFFHCWSKPRRSRRHHRWRSGHRFVIAIWNHKIFFTMETIAGFSDRPKRIHKQLGIKSPDLWNDICMAARIDNPDNSPCSKIHLQKESVITPQADRAAAFLFFSILN